MEHDACSAVLKVPSVEVPYSGLQRSSDTGWGEVSGGQYVMTGPGRILVGHAFKDLESTDLVSTFYLACKENDFSFTTPFVPSLLAKRWRPNRRRINNNSLTQQSLLQEPIRYTMQPDPLSNGYVTCIGSSLPKRVKLMLQPQSP